MTKVKKISKSATNPKDMAASTRAPLHLFPAVGAIYGAMACRQGAEEYGPYNWRDKAIGLMNYIGALERHIARLKDGQWVDRKSGQPHLGHIIATSAIMLDADECGTLVDDRPNKLGHAGSVLDQIEDKLRHTKDTDNGD